MAEALVGDDHDHACVGLFTGMHLALADGDCQLVDLTVEDLRRAAELVGTYADLRLRTTDATVFALGERLGCGRWRRWIDGTATLCGLDTSPR